MYGIKNSPCIYYSLNAAQVQNLIVISPENGRSCIHLPKSVSYQKYQSKVFSQKMQFFYLLETSDMYR